jgi:D-arabinose 5-phosphate isomerase GutQ
LGASPPTTTSEGKVDRRVGEAKKKLAHTNQRIDEIIDKTKDALLRKEARCLFVTGVGRRGRQRCVRVAGVCQLGRKVE